MGANAQTSVPDFTAGQVLTAQQQTEINTGIPVFATSVERDAAFGGTGEKTLAEGQYAYLEDTNTTQYYDGAAWVAVGASGLTLISATTIGTTVGSVTVSGAFSTTYDAYKITITGGTGSTTSILQLTLGAAVTGYYQAMNLLTYAGVANTNVGANIAYFYAGEGATSSLIANVGIQNPFNTKNTMFTMAMGAPRTAGYSVSGNGYLNDTTSYTAFTITPNAGTLTGGVIRVYGYQNS